MGSMDTLPGEGGVGGGPAEDMQGVGHRAPGSLYEVPSTWLGVEM